jgi:hypothetical protein
MASNRACILPAKPASDHGDPAHVKQASARHQHRYCGTMVLRKPFIGWALRVHKQDAVLPWKHDKVHCSRSGIMVLETGIYPILPHLIATPVATRAGGNTSHPMRWGSGLRGRI